ncbi:MAG: hypothetical protein ACRD2D_13415, partial [Terriglobales bacterium]
ALPAHLASELRRPATRARSAHGASQLPRVVIEGPVNTPWTTRDLRVTDPVGTRLIFTALNPNTDPKQKEMLRKMIEAGKSKP